MQYQVKTDSLRVYSRQLILYAIRNKRADVIDVMQYNGITVPAGTDDKTLFAMVLKAMVSSTSFREDLIALLQEIAAQKRATSTKNMSFVGRDGKWYNADGTPAITTNTPSPTPLVSNDTVNGIISKAIDTLVYKLTDGNVGGNVDKNIKQEVAIPEQAPKKSNTIKTVAITAVVVAATAGILWYVVYRKK